MILKAPELLNETHNTRGFLSGVDSLDTWLKTRALKNQKTNASRTYVVCNEDRVVAYYVLASSAVDASIATGRLRRNMPNPVPVVVLGRLAVDVSCQKSGIGRGLIRDAGFRVLHAAETIGIRGFLVQAISFEAKEFYERAGFEPSLIDPMILMITLEDLRASITL